MSSLAICPSERHRAEPQKENQVFDCQCQDIINGLTSPNPWIDSKYLYDNTGSQLFDAICDLDEYYPTRTEQAILVRHIDEIVQEVPAKSRLIEYGAGSSLKTRTLLHALPNSVDYLPVDISAEHLHRTADRLRLEFPQRSINPVVADFALPFEIPVATEADKLTTMFFPGSTIGNFELTQAEELLKRMRAQAGDGGGLIIGFDLQKDQRVLQAAYDDVFGVTAAFNKNVLLHVNRIIGSDFDPADFRHNVQYNDDSHRIEIYLQCCRAQRIHVGGHQIVLNNGDRIRTEYSHKYTLSAFDAMAKQCGWKISRHWTDAREYFAIAKFDATNASA